MKHLPSIYLKSSNSSLITTLLLAFIMFICFWGQFDRDEWTPDEPRVVAISIEMAETGNFIIPHLAGDYFIEKPPLYFALSAGAILLLPTLDPINAIRILNIYLALLTIYFTFLLGKEVKDVNTGYLAAIVLGTMEGFVIQTHWTRVDNLLILTVTASVWALYASFSRKKYLYLFLGAFVGGLAFLVKGLIGVLLIGAIWLAMIIRFSMDDLKHYEHQRYILTKKSLLMHLIALLIFSSVTGIWLILLKFTTSEEIWYEWFWVNHVGRFMGTTPELGHLHSGQPFYYLKSIAEYSLPWLPVLVASVGIFVMKGIKHKQYDPVYVFLFLAIAISVIILSFSDTKRSLYLFPLLPLFSIVVACSLTECVGKWIRYFQHTWLCFCFSIMAALLLLPLYASMLTNTIPASALEYLNKFNWRSLLVLLSVVVLVYAWMSKQQFKWFHKIALATALLYFSVFSVLNPAINQVKSMRNNTDAFVKEVPPAEREHIAGYLLSETALASLVISDNWKVITLHSNDTARVINILLGKDPQFSSVLIEHKGETSNILQTLGTDQIEYNIIAIGFYRGISQEQGLYWIKGVTQQAKKTEIILDEELNISKYQQIFINKN